MPKQPYDPIKDFATIDMIAISATAEIVHSSVPVKNLKELIDYAKANPGKLSYGSAGAGTVTNLAGEMFKYLAGNLDIVHIPYKGANPGISDLISGQIPMMTPNITGQLIELHKSGKIRILAVNTPTRLKALPDVPTASETLAGNGRAAVQRPVRAGRHAEIRRRQNLAGHTRRSRRAGVPGQADRVRVSSPSSIQAPKRRNAS